jgi:hypothetical protein
MKNLITTNDSVSCVNQATLKFLEDECNQFKKKVDNLAAYDRTETLLSCCTKNQETFMKLFKDVCKELKPCKNNLNKDEKLQIGELKRKFIEVISKSATKRREIKIELNRRKANKRYKEKQIIMDYSHPNSVIILTGTCFILWIKRAFSSFFSRNEIDQNLSDIEFVFALIEMETLLQGANLKSLQQKLGQHEAYLTLVYQQRLTGQQYKRRELLVQKIPQLKQNLKMLSIA